MTYSKQLQPWCIIRVLPDKQKLLVARFRKRDDAVAYLQMLPKSIENIKFLIIFDVQGVENFSENNALN